MYAVAALIWIYRRFFYYTRYCVCNYDRFFRACEGKRTTAGSIIS